MGLRSQAYWNDHSADYPFQIIVPWMTRQDPDPREVQRTVSFNFLRVVIGGKAHWGFITQPDLDLFKSKYQGDRK
jgi:hypothetical protein